MLISLSKNFRVDLTLTGLPIIFVLVFYTLSVVFSSGAPQLAKINAGTVIKILKSVLIVHMD
jgi:hypothetical protein|tara:strand:- start:568 stop:753 length:186 start_codon:yes stop_codon:yes gene_type:complete